MAYVQHLAVQIRLQLIHVSDQHKGISVCVTDICFEHSFQDSDQRSCPMFKVPTGLPYIEPFVEI